MDWQRKCLVGLMDSSGAGIVQLYIEERCCIRETTFLSRIRQCVCLSGGREEQLSRRLHLLTASAKKWAQKRKRIQSSSADGQRAPRADKRKRRGRRRRRRSGLLTAHSVIPIAATKPDAIGKIITASQRLRQSRTGFWLEKRLELIWTCISLPRFHLFPRTD